MATITEEQLRSMLRQAIKRHTPELVEVRYVNSHETELLPADADCVAKDVAGRAAALSVGKIDVTYLVDHDFEYALTVDILC